MNARIGNAKPTQVEINNHIVTLADLTRMFESAQIFGVAKRLHPLMDVIDEPVPNMIWWSPMHGDPPR